MAAPASAAAPAPPPLQCFGQFTAQIQKTAWQPCGTANGTETLNCCAQGDFCLPSGLCKYTRSEVGGSGFYSGGCTDSTFKDSKCPQICNAQKVRDVKWNDQNRVWSCCGANAQGGPNCDNPTNENFDASPPQRLRSTYQAGVGPVSAPTDGPFGGPGRGPPPDGTFGGPGRGPPPDGPPPPGGPYPPGGTPSPSGSSPSSSGAFFPGGPMITAPPNINVADNSPDSTTSSSRTRTWSRQPITVTVAPSSENKGGVSAGLAGGIGAACAIVAILLGVIAFMLFRRRKRKQLERSRGEAAAAEKTMETPGTAGTSHFIPGEMAGRRRSSFTSGGETAVDRGAILPLNQNIVEANARSQRTPPVELPYNPGELPAYRLSSQTSRTSEQPHTGLGIGIPGPAAFPYDGLVSRPATGDDARLRQQRSTSPFTQISPQQQAYMSKLERERERTRSPLPQDSSPDVSTYNSDLHPPLHPPFYHSPAATPPISNPTRDNNPLNNNNNTSTTDLRPPSSHSTTIPIPPPRNPLRNSIAGSGKTRSRGSSIGQSQNGSTPAFSTPNYGTPQMRQQGETPPVGATAAALRAARESAVPAGVVHAGREKRDSETSVGSLYSEDERGGFYGHGNGHGHGPGGFAGGR